MDQDRLKKILEGSNQLYEQAAGEKRKAPEDDSHVNHTANTQPQQQDQPSSSAATNSNKTAPSNDTAQRQPVRKPGKNAIIVNGKRQKRNRIVGMLRVPVEYDQIEPDFITGPTTCVLFLQLKYHRIHPEYIGRRVEKLGRDFELRILMLKVEEDDRGFESAIKEITRLAVYTNLTLIVIWSDEDGARYLKNLKMLDTATPKAIMGQNKTVYEDQLQDVVTSVRGVNKNNATTLVSTYGSLRDAIIESGEGNASKATKLEDIIGWGPVRAKAFKEAINAPFLGSSGA